MSSMEPTYDLEDPVQSGLGLSKTDDEWAHELEAALIATRRDDPQARHQCGVCPRLCMQRVPRVPANPHGEESLNTDSISAVSRLAFWASLRFLNHFAVSV